MTVEQLIAALQSLPPKSKVLVEVVGYEEPEGCVLAAGMNPEVVKNGKYVTIRGVEQ